MGHTWRELDPAGAAAQDRYWARVNALREKLKDLPMSNFTVVELGPVMRLMGLSHTQFGQVEMSEWDVKTLEVKAEKLVRKKTRKNKTKK